MSILRFIWKCKGTRMAITNLKKNYTVRGSDLPEKKIYRKLLYLGQVRIGTSADTQTSGRKERVKYRPFSYEPLN